MSGDNGYDYDFIVIGSGFGGSVSALRLAEKGYSVGVLEKGKRTRTVVFPKGSWQGDDGATVTGPCTQDIQVPLARLPHYRLMK